MALPPSFADERRPLIKHIKTRNERLEGKFHPKTNIPFKKYITQNIYGIKIEAVGPVFTSVFDIYLQPDNFTSSDAKQFKYCNKQLHTAVKQNPSLAKSFSSEQLQMIASYQTPVGYTWHHDLIPGHMQLIDKHIHQLTGHTGGKKIWGGGKICR